MSSQKESIFIVLNKIERQLEFFSNKPIFALMIIGIISILLRIIILDIDIPIRQDANAYFWYAMDMSILKKFPESGHTNDGWPMILSPFFAIFNFSNYLELTMLQRVIAISFSISTIVPLYYFCKKFFSSTYALIGVALFTFEPHIIQNSVLGLSEPLFIFLIILSYYFFLKNNKLFFLSFIIIGFATIVRAEGTVNLLVFLVMLLVRDGTSKKNIKKYGLGIGIFLLIFIPMMIFKTETSGNPSTALYVAEFSIGSAINPDESGINFLNFVNGIEAVVKKLGQLMIPYFALFMPFGLIIILQNRNKNKNLFLVLSFLIIYVLISVRMMMAVKDLRLILILIPFLSILSTYTIQYISERINFKNTFLVLFLLGIILSSWFFSYSSINREYEHEAVAFSRYIVENVSVSNNYYPESGYIYGVWASSNLKFPILNSDVKYTGTELLDYVKETNFVYIDQSANSIEEYIRLARDQNLSHLVIDSNEKRQLYFKDVFYHEKNYPYLIKEFDSVKEGYKHYNVKVFKIDYEYFDSKLKDN